jgi:para-nitrobenzyl esterase
VRDNIANFGADPNNVTLFGQSGGGGKVSSLMAMPAAHGLFRRAIVQSGASVKGISHDAASQNAERYLARLNLKPSQLDQLPNLSVDQLLKATEGSGPPVNFGPVVDGKSLPADPFDPTAPALSGNVPLLIGTVETEVTFFPGQPLEPMDDATFHGRVKQLLRTTNDADVDRLIAAYRKGRPDRANTDLYLIMASDASFRVNILTEAERKAEQTQAAVYQYYFTWRSPVRDGKLRTFHTLEIPFVFDNVDACKSMTGSGADRLPLAQKMSSAWVAFARTGNPNHPTLPNWVPYDNTRRAVMIFNTECGVINDPYGDEQRLLHSLQVRA